jgi:ubiquinone/menaquinone biosynthesis C-methylase UbiE
MEMGWLEKTVLQTSAWGWLSRRLLIPWVLAFARPREDAEVLELGCGSGSETEALLERFPGWELMATDYDPEMVALARDRLARHGSRVRVQAADATSLPFRDSSFDLVIAVLVWHHVGNWQRAPPRPIASSGPAAN